jgi:transcriptional regulator with PAS, ATPase and Fis domain
MVADVVVELLQQFRWPGYIREVQHAVDRAVILREGEELSIDDVIQQVALPVSAVSVALLSLEMKRLVRQLPGRRYVRNQ